MSTPTFEDIAAAFEAAARGLHEDNWCQGYVAKNQWGGVVHAESNDACRWCATGYVYRYLHEHGFSAQEVDDIVLPLNTIGYGLWHVVTVNDEEGLEPVRKLCKDIAHEARKRA